MAGLAMTARIIAFPQRLTDRGVRIEREWCGDGWLVTYRDHSWLFADFKSALEEAHKLADLLEVEVIA